MTIQRYGWVKDVPDHRDLRMRYAAPVEVPERVDLRAACPPVVNQSWAGSCVGNAVASALLFAGMRQDDAPVELSRLFIYYNARAIAGTVNEDAGCQIRDAIKSVAQQGACLELAWPYDLTQLFVKPSAVAYYDAQQRQAIAYRAVPQQLNALQACLASGYPIVFGFMVFKSFESAEVIATGRLDLPGPHETPIGGHAVKLVGYSVPEQRFIVRNSYGESFGDKGYFTMPFDYVCNPNLADDFWVIQSVEHLTPLKGP